MKRLSLFVMFAIVGNVFALQPRFEVEYVNHAWGYDNRGCLIDFEGNIYQYAYGHSTTGKGIQKIGTVSATELQKADALAEKAMAGTYREEHAAFDAGTTLWTAVPQFGRLVKLQADGDVKGTNSAPEAQELVSWLNGVCAEDGR